MLFEHRLDDVLARVKLESLVVERDVKQLRIGRSLNLRKAGSMHSHNAEHEAFVIPKKTIMLC